MIKRRQIVFSVPWFDVEAKDTDLDPQPFYSLKLADYVAIVATTTDGKMILVRQYRPAVEETTLELPSALVDPGERPEETARRELAEETGYGADRFEHLGTLHPDTGRLQNALWCYAARGAAPIPGATGERGIQVVLMNPDQVNDAVGDGRFKHALHVAALALASRG